MMGCKGSFGPIVLACKDQSVERPNFRKQVGNTSLSQFLQQEFSQPSSSFPVSHEAVPVDIQHQKPDWQAV